VGVSLAACGDDTPAESMGDSGSSTGPAATGSDTVSPTTADPTDTSAGSSGASSGDTTAGPTSGTDSTGPGTDSSGGTDSTGEAGRCGNDVVEGGETCDGIDLSGADCESEGFDDGTLACARDCTFDTSGCVTFMCGNDMLEGTEVCDGAALGGETCESQGEGGGTLACLGDCSGFDPAGCWNCGDGTANPGEDCDGLDLGGETCTSQGVGMGILACNGDCTFDFTGCDGVAPGECNEMLGVPCAVGQFCDYPDAMCGAGANGTCLPAPGICPLIFDPQCGCDGVTHSNECIANGAGTDVDYAGPC
jgi:hypothetical protein